MARDPGNVTGAERFVAGGAAGAAAQVAVYPLEICKTRLAIAKPGAHSQKVPSIVTVYRNYTRALTFQRICQGMYKGLAGCLRVVVKKEGVGALYKGLGTSVIGIVPYAGIDLAVNSVLKDAASKVYSARGEEPGVTSVLACGMISSTIAMLATYPINLVRTRLQASGMPGSPKYASPMDVVRQAVRAGGPAALFQGLLPNLMKVLPATSISYAVYDQLSKEAPSGKKKGPSPG